MLLEFRLGSIELIFFEIFFLFVFLDIRFIKTKYTSFELRNPLICVIKDKVRLDKI